MKLTVLADNYTYIDRYFFGEPAVSYYIELENERILFDAGYSDVFLKNAALMGIDLTALTHVVLSHGHNDHTRGLSFLCGSVGIENAALIAHPGCFAPKYDSAGYIGAPYTEAELARKTHYVPCAKPFAISKNCVFLGAIPRTNNFENTSPVGLTELNGKLTGDYVPEDSALAYHNENGIFIITGCSHSGICNIVSYAMEVCGDRRVTGIIGGFHLFDDDEQLKKTIAFLAGLNVSRLYPCHCVSLKAKARMLASLPVEEVGVGMTLCLS